MTHPQPRPRKVIATRVAEMPAAGSAVTTLSRWGNGMGVRLTKGALQAASLEEGQRLEVQVLDDGRILLTALKPARQTLEERLRRFDAEEFGGEGEFATGADRGAEML